MILYVGNFIKKRYFIKDIQADKSYIYFHQKFFFLETVLSIVATSGLIIYSLKSLKTLKSLKSLLSRTLFFIY
jgi:hypothetical protein